jgi:hypothetical protein
VTLQERLPLVLDFNTWLAEVTFVLEDEHCFFKFSFIPVPFFVYYGSICPLHAVLVVPAVLGYAGFVGFPPLGVFSVFFKSFF